MRAVVCALSAALSLGLASAASATTYDITIRGTLDSVSGGPPAPGTSLVGSELVMHATFTDFYIVDNGANLTGWTKVTTDLTSHPTFFGVPAPFSITLGSFVWGTGDATESFLFFDDNTNPTKAFWRSPNITFTPFGVVGLGGGSDLLGNFAIGQPELLPQSGAPGGPRDTIVALFQVRGSPLITYTGKWDLANAVVLTDGVNLAASAPEPAVWTEMILGFGLLGARLRAQRTRPALKPSRAHKTWLACRLKPVRAQGGGDGGIRTLDTL
jgi:hypothetical protein